MRDLKSAGSARGRRGSALVIVMLVVVAMAGLSLSLLAITNSSNEGQRETRERVSAMYVAEAGIGQALFDLQNGGTGVQGSEQNPLNYEQSDVWVDVTDLGDGRLSLLSTGTDKGASYRVEVIVEGGSTSNFIWAAFGDQGVVMNSNSITDSFNSTLGTYDDQDVNGSGNDKYALEGGHVGSNGDVEMYSNTTVHGNAQPGPTGVVLIPGNGEVSGSTTPASQPIPLDAVVIPTIAPSGSFFVSGNSSGSLAAGSYFFSSFLLDSNADVHITGPATIVVTDMTLSSNTRLIVDATAGPVEFFVLRDFEMDSNTLIASTTFTPSDIAINLEGDNVADTDIEIDLSSNASLYGTLYAPNSFVALDSNFQLYGSLIAYQVELNSNSGVHFDEVLASGSAGAAATYSMAMWRGAPYQPGMTSSWTSAANSQSGY